MICNIKKLDVYYLELRVHIIRKGKLDPLSMNWKKNYPNNVLLFLFKFFNLFCLAKCLETKLKNVMKTSSKSKFL